ncbi:hypothetical protein N9242_06600, partial [Vicingaceae bacterium]|nr:hypothetical protein [Vicingaceae bacterium]
FSTFLIAMVFFFLAITVFGKYKKLKMLESSDFNPSKYQSQMPGNYLIKPIYISENDTTPQLVTLSSKYNRIIKLWWYFMGVLVVFVLISIALGYIFE